MQILSAAAYHCWTNLFEQYGTNMRKLTQTVSPDSASVQYRIILQGGEEKGWVCHSVSGEIEEIAQADLKNSTYGN
jgi:hypothetical protein